MRLKASHLHVAALIVIIGISPIDWARSQSGSSDTFTLNLNNVEIRSLIETVSRQTGRNFIVDPRVKATVSVISAKPVNAHKLYELFLSVLDVHGYAAVPAGSVTKIVPMATGVQSAVPVQAEQASAPDRLANDGLVENGLAGDELTTTVIKVEHIPAQQLIEGLRPLLPATASFSAEPDSNSVVITDRAANIARLTEIVRRLDRPN